MCLRRLETNKTAVRINPVCQACECIGYSDCAKCSHLTLPADLSSQQEELKVPANNRGYQHKCKFAVQVCVHC